MPVLRGSSGMTQPRRTPARLALIVFSFSGLALAACQQEASPTPETPSTPVATAAPVTPPAPATTAPNLPAPLVPEAEKGEKGARNVLLGFARALENRQFDTAFALLGGSARGEQSEADFTAQWSDLRNISVAIVDGQIEGGAGSLYYTTQTTITAEDQEGRPIRFEGPIVLRRVNDVDGASAAQLRWHLESFNVVQTH